MKPLPKTKDPIVLRTDFSDDAAWQALRKRLVTEDEFGWQAYVDIIDDPGYSGVTAEEVLAGIGSEYQESFLIIADRTAFADNERPLLVLDLHQERGHTFRVIPGHLADITSNLPIGNMDFAEFAEACDRDNVFRGFAGDRGLNRKKLPNPIRPYQPTLLGRVLIGIWSLFRRKPER